MKKFLSLSLAAVGLSTCAGAAQIYGLSTRNQLVSFNSSSPIALQMAVFINGMASNESMLGIDFRPANGMLYGLGSFGNIYTINTSTGVASFVAGMTTSAGAVALNGVEFGFDFNPVADRIRVISNLGQNLRVNPLTGATILDGSINPGGYSIVGSAYTNSDTDPTTGTTLYNIDSVSDLLTMQNPPNNGTQVAIGGLGVDVTALAGFDILTQGTSNMAYAALQPVGTAGSRLYTINLGSGAATLVGSIGLNQTSDSLAIRDIAVSPVPEPATMVALATGAIALLRRRRK